MNPTTPPKNFVSDPFAYHQEIELRIDDLSNLGIGVGRVDDWVVMVPFALPGETVRARVFRNRSSYSEADLIEVLNPAPERVAPQCPLFGTCGGCQYQHLSYEGQLRWKVNQVGEAFRRIGASDQEIRPAIGSPREYGYRSKITPHYDRWSENGDFPIGFLHVNQRNRIIDVPACPIATEAINRELPGVRDETRSKPPRKKRNRGATLLLREGMEGVITDPNERMTERGGKEGLPISSR